MRQIIVNFFSKTHFLLWLSMYFNIKYIFQVYSHILYFPLTSEKFSLILSSKNLFDKYSTNETLYSFLYQNLLPNENIAMKTKRNAIKHSLCKFIRTDENSPQLNYRRNFTFVVESESMCTNRFSNPMGAVPRLLTCVMSVTSNQQKALILSTMDINVSMELRRLNNPPNKAIPCTSAKLMHSVEIQNTRRLVVSYINCG